MTQFVQYHSSVGRNSDFSDRTDDYFARQQVPRNCRTSACLRIYSLACAGYQCSGRGVPLCAANPKRPRRHVPFRLGIAPRATSGSRSGGRSQFRWCSKRTSVHIDPFRLRKYNVTINQVAQALANSNNGGGGLRSEDEFLVVRSIGLFKPADIARVVIILRMARRFWSAGRGRDRGPPCPYCRLQ